MVAHLENLNIYSYLELSPKTILIDTSSFRVTLNTDLSQSFKLLPIPLTDSNKPANPDQSLPTTAYLDLKLFPPLSDHQHQQSERVITSLATIKYNTRLSVSLALSQLLLRHATVFRIMSEKSHYHGKLAQLIERVVDEYKEPPKILEESAADENMLEGVRQVYLEAYSNKVFLRLSEQMVSEKK